jgi:hypothetical protein
VGFTPGYGHTSKRSFGPYKAWTVQRVSLQRSEVVRNRPGSIVASWLDNLATPLRPLGAASTSKDARLTSSLHRGC